MVAVAGLTERVKSWTVNIGLELLATPLTVTTTGPVFAPAGTVATICVLLQLEVSAGTPLKVIVLDPCGKPKLEPLMVIEVLTTELEGVIEVITGDNRVGERTVRVVFPLTPPEVAVIVVEPGLTPVATPFALIVATAMLPLLQTMVSAVLIPETVTGVAELVVVPFPSSPRRLCPQH